MSLLVNSVNRRKWWVLDPFKIEVFPKFLWYDSHSIYSKDKKDQLVSLSLVSVSQMLGQMFLIETKMCRHSLGH